MLKIGVIADDFTGASDASSFLANAKLNTVMFNGIPNTVLDDTTQAVVIALKTRTISADKAVSGSLEAIQWLQHAGAEKLYFKYCSTFDSNKEGNIGPVADRIMEQSNFPMTILCPALPVNGRTVKNGMLFVNGVLLNESSMRSHPLTPMWDARIAELMRNQSKYPVFNISRECMQSGQKCVHDYISLKLQELKSANRDDPNYGKDDSHYYVVPDYCDDDDADLIIRTFGDLKFLTGGSGILGPLGWKLSDKRGVLKGRMKKPTGKALLLAGSCSTATLAQVETFRRCGKPSFRINPEKLLNGDQGLTEMEDFIEENSDEDVLMYSSAPSDEVKKNQLRGGSKEQVSSMLEQVMAELAKWAVSTGRSRIIIAGGETSGAVTKGLGFNSYHIRDSVTPGVPVIIPFDNTAVRLVLKSGNFGNSQFFMTAIDKTRE